MRYMFCNSIANDDIQCCEVYLPRSDMINVEKEITAYSRKLIKLDQDIAKLDKQLSSNGFMTKAPAALVEEMRQLKEEKLQQRHVITEKLTMLRKS